MAATYTVKKGDTLSEIAQKYMTQYNLGSTIAAATKKLAEINGISNPNYIVVGQVIKLQQSTTTSSSGSTNTVSNQANITAFGIQSNTDRTLFASWSWSRSNTENYSVMWTYDTGDGVWFVGNNGTENFTHSLYNAPSNAIRVRFQVKPISKTHTVNDKEVSYWTASWSTVKTFDFRTSSPPSKPSTPTVTLDSYTLTASLDNLDVNADTIEFRVIQNDNKIAFTGKAKIKLGFASYSFKVSAGSRYKVCCRSVQGTRTSDWSDYSSNTLTPPSIPKNISVYGKTESSIIVKWDAVDNATSYTLEYATKIEYFNGSDQVTSVSSVETTSYEKTGLESAKEYFFRVKAVNDAGSSGWSEIDSTWIGTTPDAPTTWSSSTTIMVGDKVKLYYVHNSKDNGNMMRAQISWTIDGVTYGTPTQFDPDYKAGDIKYYELDTSSYTEGTTITWKIRTLGLNGQYGPWSVERVIKVYSPPTIAISTMNSNSEVIDTVNGFPFYIHGVFGPSSQNPIGFTVSIISVESYETVDNVGNIKMVNAGEEIYSKVIDSVFPYDENQDFHMELSASDITLENGITYKVILTVTMDSGLIATDVNTFLVSWNELTYIPNAEIGINKDSLTAIIRPYCIAYPTRYYSVVYNKTSGIYTKTTDLVLANVEGILVDNAYTTTNEAVYMYSTSAGDTAYFCSVTNNFGELVSDAILSVYRREYDGTFTEIARDLANTESTYVTDPHPSLDYARYRIVATSSMTGAVGYYDVPGYPVEEKTIVIQWDEQWTNFDSVVSDALVEQNWTGSMLKLPYNIDVSNKYNPDVENVNYIGRKHPVSYYGTHIGETATWSTVIEHDDIDTLYALRRLAIWMGDVYVREPSGSGYWANVNVSFKQTHLDLTIPVTLEITRVEGGA